MEALTTDDPSMIGGYELRARLGAANPQAQSNAEQTVNDIVGADDSNAPARSVAVLARLERQHRLGHLTEAEIAQSANDRKLDETALAGLDKAARNACKPIDDKRGTIAYRIKVAGVLARRAATIAYKRAGERP